MIEFHEKINILIATHRAFIAPKNPIYRAIEVGQNPKIPHFLHENQLDNIAHKNPSFCELTILYWIWKNLHSPMVGLVHYRRYFFAHDKPVFWEKSLRKILFYLKCHDLIAKTTFAKLPDEAQIAAILHTHDAILPKPQYFDMSVREQYQMMHHVQDWDIVRDIVAEKYPDYLAAFDAVQTQNWLYYGNMFVAKKPLINAYCAWLFDILFEAEKRIDTREYNAYNQRVFGFLSERLFTVWVVHHQNDWRFTTLPVHQLKYLTL